MRPLPPRQRFLEGVGAADAALRVQMEAWLAAAQNAEAGDAPPGEGTSEITQTLLDQTPLTEGPGTVIGHYRLLEKIGEGGFGAVYALEEREPVKRQVALKIIKLGMDTRQVVARFESERQPLALMDHPNIAKVLDAGATDSGRPSFVMELVRGIPITQHCDQNNLPKQKLTSDSPQLNSPSTSSHNHPRRPVNLLPLARLIHQTSTLGHSRPHPRASGPDAASILMITAALPSRQPNHLPSRLAPRVPECHTESWLTLPTQVGAPNRRAVGPSPAAARSAHRRGQVGSLPVDSPDTRRSTSYRG